MECSYGMFKRLVRVLHGWLYWTCFKLLNRISYKCVILVLASENTKLDVWAVRHLEDFIKRKCADKAMIIYHDKAGENASKELHASPSAVQKKLPLKRVELIYDYYCFDRFFDNIVFTYVSVPDENLLGRILNETDITENEAVCLALYHLREVPIWRGGVYV